MTRYIRLLLIFTTAAILLSSFRWTRAENREHEIKAAMLEKFATFIRWPDKTHSQEADHYFVMGVMGESPIAHILPKMYLAQTIQDKPVLVQTISDVRELAKCHLLYISRSEADNVDMILSHTKGNPILTVGDTRGFSEKGVIINFYTDRDKVKFEINETAVRESGLYISHLLLRLARIVHPIKD